MKVKRLLCMALICFIAVKCFAVSAKAANKDEQDNRTEVTLSRAVGRFSASIPGKELFTADKSFPLEMGEEVTIQANYSPKSADVDFGLIAPDGLFYPVNASGGSIDVAIAVNQNGNYTFAIRNNSDVEIAVAGIVNY